MAAAREAKNYNRNELRLLAADVPTLGYDPIGVTKGFIDVAGKMQTGMVRSQEPNNWQVELCVHSLRTLWNMQSITGRPQAQYGGGPSNGIAFLEEILLRELAVRGCHGPLLGYCDVLRRPPGSLRPTVGLA